MPRFASGADFLGIAVHNLVVHPSNVEPDDPKPGLLWTDTSKLDVEKNVPASLMFYNGIKWVKLG